jgi:hypothetical protein
MAVAAALCPGFDYDDPEGIADGAAAFLRLTSGCLTATAATAMWQPKSFADNVRNGRKVKATF